MGKKKQHIIKLKNDNFLYEDLLLSRCHKLKFILFLFFLYPVLMIKAQEEKPVGVLIEKRTIHGSGASTSKFFINMQGKTIDVSPFGKGWRSYVEDKPKALKHLNRFRNKRIIGTSLGTVAIIGGFWWVFHEFQNSTDQYMMLGGLGVLLVSGYVSVKISKKKSNQINRRI